jgi:hypothetical protein
MATGIVCVGIKRLVPVSIFAGAVRLAGIGGWRVAWILGIQNAWTLRCGMIQALPGMPILNGGGLACRHRH